MYVEHGVYGYILVARRVLYMAGSLRYRGIKHPWFNAHSLQCKNTPYAHCTHFSHVKYTCLQYNIMVKKHLETLVYWTWSVWLHFIKHPWFNAHSVQCKNTPYDHCMHFSHVKYTCLRNIVALKLQRICLETRVFNRRYRSDPALFSTLPAYKSFKLRFQHFCTVSKVFYMEKEGTVCAYFAKRHSL